MGRNLRAVARTIDPHNMYFGGASQHPKYRSGLVQQPVLTNATHRTIRPSEGGAGKPVVKPFVQGKAKKMTRRYENSPVFGKSELYGMGLADLGEVSKQQLDTYAPPEEKKSKAGRKLAGGGAALYGAGIGSYASGMKAAKPHLEHALTTGSLPKKGMKRMTAGALAGGVGGPAILAGGAIGAHNMYQNKKRKQAQYANAG